MLAVSEEDLLAASLEDLTAQAREVRDRTYGKRITFSPKVFIPLTQLCRDRCGYCTFAKPARHVSSAYLELDEVVTIAAAGAAAGCHEALFTLGESPESRYRLAAQWLADHGFSSTVEYLYQACKAVVSETGLLPHANAGALSRDELAMLREVSASQGMMLESLTADLACHRAAPDKEPKRRLVTLETAGELAIPFTTGLLVGIGETRRSRIASLCAIAESHLRHGHVQEVIIQNFLPKTGTAMHAWPACDPVELLWTIAVARIVLPAGVHVQAPPNLSDDLKALMDAGIDDWGGVSPVTADHVNPERAWPEVAVLRANTEAAGHTLAPRLTLYPEYASDPDRWLDSSMRFAVLDASDAESLARDHPWCTGGDVQPPNLIELRPASRSSSGSRVEEILDGVLLGQEVDEEEIEALFSARGREVERVAELADHLRRSVVGDEVTWVANRNINYTNICTFKCRFCAFSKGPLSLNLRGDPYLLPLEEITRRVAEAEQAGATEVCLQGGIHPSFDGSYYLDVIAAVRSASKSIHIHGFTALEVTEGARRAGMGLEEYLAELKAAGLRTLPGTAAEILDDEVRAVLCPDKITTEQWLEVHSIAHGLGLRSNVTIMFGAVETPRHWARHLVRTRELQKRTGGFTELVPLPFVHMASPIYLQHRARRGPTFREAILMHAVGRIAYHGWIDNIQASWVKLGMAGVRQALMAGANDLGGTLMDENISRAAGASHGQRMTEQEFKRIVEPIGRILSQRTTLYGRVKLPPMAATGA